VIASISYLVSEDERKRVVCEGGKFTLKKKASRYGAGRGVKTFTAKSFVEFVKDRDPYITLNGGTKMRVYRGGYSGDVVIETICIVEAHDERFSTKTKEETQPIIPDYPDYGW